MHRCGRVPERQRFGDAEGGVAAHTLPQPRPSRRVQHGLCGYGPLGRAGLA